MEIWKTICIGGKRWIEMRQSWPVGQLCGCRLQPRIAATRGCDRSFGRLGTLAIGAHVV